jgi:hypothetical protein
VHRALAPRPAPVTAPRRVLHTRAGREFAVGCVPGIAPLPASGHVLLEIVRELDEHDGVLRAGLMPDEARRLAEDLLAQADAAEGPPPA